MKPHFNNETAKLPKQKKSGIDNIKKKLHKYKEIKYILFNLFIIYLIIFNGYMSYKTKYIWIFGYESTVYTYIRGRAILASFLDILYFIINLMLIIQLKKVIDKFYKGMDHYVDEQNANINGKAKFTYIVLVIYTYFQLFIHIIILSKVILYRFPEHILMSTFIWAFIFSQVNTIFFKMRIMAKEVRKWE